MGSSRSSSNYTLSRSMTNTDPKRRKWRVVLTLVTISLALTIVTFGFSSRSAHYLFAIFHLEPTWRNHDPQTRAEFEAITCCTRSRPADPSMSDWGSGHVLAPGEEMVQYGIFGDFSVPFEVVYDREGRIVARYTSYE